jgi:hypothetical protein
MVMAMMPTVTFAAPGEPVIVSATAHQPHNGWQKFSVDATGEGLRYQWQVGYEAWDWSGMKWLTLSDNDAYYGTDNKTFMIGNINLGGGAFFVRCVVTNNAGQVTTQKLPISGWGNLTTIHLAVMPPLKQPFDWEYPDDSLLGFAGDGFTVESVRWLHQKRQGNLIAFKGRFLQDIEYNVELTLKLDENRYFDPDEFSARFGNRQAVVFRNSADFFEAHDYWSEGMVRIRLAVNIVPLTPIPITTIEVLGDTRTAVNQSPVTELSTPPGSHYTVKKVEWTEGSTANGSFAPFFGTFVSGKFYMLKVSLRTENGYVFEPTWSQISIGGEQAAGYSSTDSSGRPDPNGADGNFCVYRMYLVP